MERNLKLLHCIHGRMRIKLTVDEGAKDITGIIRNETGIVDASFSPVTRNILVRYDPEILTDRKVLSLVGNLSGIFDRSSADVKGAEVLSNYQSGRHKEEPGVRATIINRFRQMNKEVVKWTGGQADLKLLFPMGILLWALFLFLSSGQWMQPSYYSLMIAAFSVFMALNLA